MSTPDEVNPDDARKSAFYLPDILPYLWKRPFFIMGFSLAGLLLACLYLHVVRYTYTIQMQVGPASSDSGSSGGFSSKLGDLASMLPVAGLGLGGNADSPQFKLYLEGIYSRSIADALARRTDLMKVIFDSEWNAHDQKWEEPQSILRSITGTVKYLAGIPIKPWTPPDGARLQEYIQKRVQVDQNLRNVLVSISYHHEDPQFGTAFLAALHEADDEHLRQTTLTRAQGYIKYISTKLTTVTVTEHRLALTQALSEQEKSMMMASGGASYAAEPFGAPAASDRPTSPVPVAILALGIFSGALMGLLMALLAELRGLAWLGFKRKA